MKDRPTPMASAAKPRSARRDHDPYRRFLVGVMFDLPTAPTDEEARRLGLTVIADSVTERFAQQQWPPEAVYTWPQAHMWYSPSSDVERHAGKTGRMTVLRSLSRVPYSDIEALTALIPSAARLNVEDLGEVYHHTVPLRWLAAAITERHNGLVPNAPSFRLKQLWTDMLGVGTGAEVDVEESIGWMRLNIRPEDGSRRRAVMPAGFKQEWAARYEQWRDVPGGPWWPLAGFGRAEAEAMLADAAGSTRRDELIRSVRILSRLGSG